MNSVLLVVLLLASACLSHAFVSTGRLRPSQLLMAIPGMVDGRKPFMGGNYKLNPRTVAEAVKLATETAQLSRGVTEVDIAIFPPHPFLVPVYSKIEATNVKLGGQNCYYETEGPYTGAVSTCMLHDVGAKYVLCGHSERRTLFRDGDEGINKKVKKVLKQGLSPVLCLGETKEEYETGLVREVCAVQILKDLKDVSPEEMKRVVLAYEPVWAIGTGLVCPAETAQEVHHYIRSLIAKKYGSDVAKSVIIQYGGSVKPDNVKELMMMPDIDGCLVGGASLNAESFAKIIRYYD